MPKVAVVRLRYVHKDYWFSPAGIAVEEGDHVVVETARGREIGVVTRDICEVEDKEIKSPLKPVLRKATEDDLAQADEMNRRSEEAMEVFKDMVEQHGLDMKPVRVEFMLTGDFATFYFSADERVDFRNLVRDLASVFHIRIDMRQIGPRDEARILGGLGHCGEELCCTRLGGEFQTVSIRMAKEQDLPLNPSKISGACGRLMCCLRYEFEAYKDFKGRAPKKNALIDTPMGLAKVVEFDTPREKIRLRMEDGSTLVVPLSSMDTDGKEPKEGEKIRPCHIGQEAFDKVMEELENDKNLAMLGEKLFSTDENLADKVAEGGKLEKGGSSRRKRRSTAVAARDAGLLTDGKPGMSSSSGRSKRKRGETAAEPEKRNPSKRRRSISVGAGTAGGEQAASESSGSRSPRRRRAPQQMSAGSTTAAASAAKQAGGKQGAGSNANAEAKDSSAPKRRRRRGGRGRGGNGGNGGESGNNKPLTRGDASASKGGEKQNAAKQGKPRPGQKSSTLHGEGADSGSGEKKSSSSSSRRRRRRRGGSHSGGANSTGANGGDNSNGGSAGGAAE